MTSPAPPTAPPKLLTLEAVALKLNVSRSTVQRLIAYSVLPSFHEAGSRRVFVRSDALDLYMTLKGMKEKSPAERQSDAETAASRADLPSSPASLEAITESPEDREARLKLLKVLCPDADIASLPREHVEEAVNVAAKAANTHLRLVKNASAGGDAA